MKEIVVNVVSGHALEIMMPVASERQRCSVLCLCCQRADQPMDDDGCGICDACLGLPVRAKEIEMALNSRPLPPIYRSPPVFDDCLQRRCSVARS
ncbi:hypothetical protein [Rhizobium sp. BR 315]|uniref:hypothetical protein n=1 Tax=Rhizobium sp. BR 315 TaxID=3040014 RepID=UPI003D3325EC